MKLETFISAGKAAYGENWATPMAEALGVSDRTVRHWRAGKNPLPPLIAADVLKILAERGRGIENAIKLIESEAE